MNRSWTSACDEWRGAVEGLCADDTAEPSAALAAHLEQCPACRAEVDESRGLAAELRSALRPPPLDTAVIERVVARAAAARRGRRVLVRFGRWGACVAAAAVLVLALRPTTGPGSGADAEALTREAVEAIAATVAAGQWDASGAGVEALAEAATTVVQTLTATQAGERGLPWGVEDDWDLPSQRGTRS